MAIDFTKSNRDYTTLQPIAQKAYLLFMDECKKQGLKIFPTDFLRTTERQYHLACKGRTAQQAIKMGVPSDFANRYANPNEKQVTWTLDSNHKQGLAWDVACSPPQNLYDDNVLRKCGEIAISLGMTWGGSFGDSPHISVSKTWKAPRPTYKPSQIKIDLFGKIKTVSTINIDNVNHIKLRDFECDKIKIEYKNNKAQINGKDFKIDGIMYENTNYINVRSLANIGFKIGWDDKNKIITIR